MSNARYGKKRKGDRLPYGTLADASKELRAAYYSYGYLNDEDMPELPCPHQELQVGICPEEELFKKELVGILDTALNTLSRRYAKVLRMRHGIDTGIDHTLEEVGYAFRVTRERIRQMESKGIRLLKNPSHKLAEAAFPERYQTTLEKQAIIFKARRSWEGEKKAAEVRLWEQQKMVQEFINKIVGEDHGRLA